MHLSFLWNNAEKLSNILLAIVTTAAFVVAVIEYRRQKKHNEEQNRPYVIVDLERVTAGLFDISIRNIGKSVAENIRITFKPNIKPYDYSDIKLNDLKFLKNMKFLPPDKVLRFYFGSIMGGKTKITQQFEVTANYKDVQGKDYTSEFVIDPSDYLELTSISQRTTDDIAKTLEEISKSLKESTKTQEELKDGLLQDGLKIRNEYLSTLSSEETLKLIVGLYDDGISYELTIGPYVYDAKLLIKQARDRLLVTKTVKDKKLLGHLNWLTENRWYYHEDEAKKHFEAIKKFVSNS